MRAAVHAVAAAGAAALLATVAMAQEMSREEKAAHTRQGLMNLFSWEAGPLFAMAKGDMTYDAAMATAHAENLAALTRYSPASLFVPGSSTEELGDKTRALPVIWEKLDEFGQAYQMLGERATVLAGEAGKGVDQLRAAAGELGKACGNCHENFRQKD